VDQLRFEEGDPFELLVGGQKLVIYFETHGHVDTVIWKVRGGTGLTFELWVDGHPIRPQNIYLGHQGHHPFSPGLRIPQ